MEEDFVDLEDVVDLVGDEVLDDDVELDGVGEGVTGAGKEVVGLGGAELEGQSKGENGALAGHVVRSGTDLREVLASEIGALVDFDVGEIFVVNDAEQKRREWLVEILERSVKRWGLGCGCCGCWCGCGCWGRGRACFTYGGHGGAEGLRLAVGIGLTESVGLAIGLDLKLLYGGEFVGFDDFRESFEGGFLGGVVCAIKGCAASRFALWMLGRFGPEIWGNSAEVMYWSMAP